MMPALSRTGASDVTLFGSQAMSVYTERALASTNLDLIAPGITIGILEELCDVLSGVAEKRPAYDFAVGEYLGRRYPVGHVYLRHNSGYPLAVDFFQTFLGYEARRLTPFLTFRDKWGLRVRVLTPEAIIGTRLSFSPPERITRYNALRLSRFIETLGKRIDWYKVNSFIDEFGLRSIVEENLEELRSKMISIRGSSRVISRATSKGEES
jgi:hypothetical protein